MQEKKSTPVLTLVLLSLAFCYDGGFISVPNPSIISVHPHQQCICVFRKPSKLSRGIHLIFNFSPALFPEHYCISHLVWLGFLKLCKQFDVLGSRREWPHSPSYINLLKEYKGHITIASPMSYKAFHANNSYHFYSDLSLSPPNTQTEKGWVRDTAKGPFHIHPSDTKLFWYRAKLVYLTLPRMIPNRLVSSLPENPYHIQIPAVDMIGLKVGWSWQNWLTTLPTAFKKQSQDSGSNAIALSTLLSLASGSKPSFFFNDSLEIQILFYNRIILLESMYFVRCIPFLDMILL